jgi:hypothetical protein
MSGTGPWQLALPNVSGSGLGYVGHLEGAGGSDDPASIVDGDQSHGGPAGAVRVHLELAGAADPSHPASRRSERTDYETKDRRSHRPHSGPCGGLGPL